MPKFFVAAEIFKIIQTQTILAASTWKRSIDAEKLCPSSSCKKIEEGEQETEIGSIQANCGDSGRAVRKYGIIEKKCNKI